jgi:putative lipase involved disintegration of autophagic bodies
MPTNSLYRFLRLTMRAGRLTQVIMTGHSLGGGIAKIVAAKLGIPVIGVSAPGIALSHRIFGVSRANVDRLEINLLSSEDIVPMFDRQSGIILQMRCPMANPLACHQLGVTMCDLFEKCGAQFAKGSATYARIVKCWNG